MFYRWAGLMTSLLCRFNCKYNGKTDLMQQVISGSALLFFRALLCSLLLRSVLVMVRWNALRSRMIQYDVNGQNKHSLPLSSNTTMSDLWFILCKDLETLRLGSVHKYTEPIIEVCKALLCTVCNSIVPYSNPLYLSDVLLPMFVVSFNYNSFLVNLF